MVKCVFRKVSGGTERLLEVETPLLLGADGIFSETRKHVVGQQAGNETGGLMGEGMGPRDNGRTIWRAIIDSSLVSHPLLQPRHSLTILAGDRVGAILNGHAGKLYWGLALADGADPTVSSSRSRSGEEAKEKILRAVKGWDVLPQLAEATPPELILERRMLDLPALPFWVKGRTALLGDAAHAMTPELGQGANMAFEDAAQMVECIRAHSHVRHALESFQSLRMPRVHAVAAMNRASAKALYGDAQACNGNGNRKGILTGAAPLIRGALESTGAAGVNRCSRSQQVQLESTGAAGVNRCSRSQQVQQESTGAAGVNRCSWSQQVQLESTGAAGVNQAA
ncbi:unnamed protein product [Closterium sp. Yama58-4]|nr:unnamed protein product [Closterium sp. Yama58-4]